MTVTRIRWPIPTCHNSFRTVCESFGDAVIKAFGMVPEVFISVAERPMLEGPSIEFSCACLLKREGFLVSLMLLENIIMRGDTTERYNCPESTLQRQGFSSGLFDRVQEITAVRETLWVYYGTILSSYNYYLSLDGVFGGPDGSSYQLGKWVS